MDYKQLKNHVRIDNIELLKYINKKEIEWLKKHFAFINSLLMGKTDRSETKYKNTLDLSRSLTWTSAICLTFSIAISFQRADKRSRDEKRKRGF